MLSRVRVVATIRKPKLTQYGVFLGVLFSN